MYILGIFLTGAPVEAGAEKGMPVRIRSSPATVSGAQAIMSLTQVGKALRAMKLSQETCLLRSLEPTGDRLALVCVNIEFFAAAAFCESPARELFSYMHKMKSMQLTKTKGG